MIKTLKVIKIEVEEEENKEKKFTSAMFGAVILTLATQWPFGMCERRNHTIATPEVQREDQQEESSDEFELVSDEDPEEAQTEETV
jgi:hypothetical protein